MPPTPLLIRVVGCSGGLGASTLACALAVELADRGEPVLLADGDAAGGRIDVTAAVEHQPGLRWGDLSHIDTPDVEALVAALPGDRVPVLSGGPGRSSGAVVGPVLAEVARWRTVVVDQPRWQPPTMEVPSAAGEVGEEVEAIDLFLVGLTPRHLHDAQVVVDDWPLGPAAIITRGRRHDDLLSEAIADHLGLPLLGHVPDDARCPVDERRGRLPTERGGVLARAAGRLLDGLPHLIIAEQPDPAIGAGRAWAS